MAATTVLEDYEFLMATEEDLDQLLDFSANNLPYLEPHCKALGIQGKDIRPLYHYILKKCLHYPYSVKVLEKRSGALVGMRAISIANRDVSLNWPPFPFDWSSCAPHMQMLGNVLTQIKTGFWTGVEPDVNKVIIRDISLVAPEHQRRGISRHLGGFGFDLESLRRDGIQGIVSEAFSIANQNLVKSLGFKCVFVPEYNWKGMLDDGTKTAMALFKDLRDKATENRSKL